MARIYLASSWRNKYQPGMVKLLREHGHIVYDFRNPACGPAGFSWAELDENWQNWTADEYRSMLFNHPRAAQGYMSDMRAMEWADVCVLLLPCGRSAHLEAGWFAGRGKTLLILTENGQEPELMAMMANHIPISPTELLETLEDY